MMNKSLRIFLLMIIAACGTKEKDLYREKIFNQTKKVNDYSLDGHISQDVDQILSAYAIDAIILPPGDMGPIIGTDAIKKYYLNGFNAGRSLKITTRNISYDVIDESHASEVGEYVITYQSAKSDEVITIEGQMLITWIRDDSNNWKIKYDMWH